MQLCYDNDYGKAMTFNPATHCSSVGFALILNPLKSVDKSNNYSFEAEHVGFRDEYTHGVVSGTRVKMSLMGYYGLKIYFLPPERKIPVK